MHLALEPFFVWGRRMLGVRGCAGCGGAAPARHTGRGSTADERGVMVLLMGKKCGSCMSNLLLK